MSCEDQGVRDRPKAGIRLRPRYCRLYTDEGVELAEENVRHDDLEWNLPLGEAALISLDVWNYELASTASMLLSTEGVH